ncbi:hypothetical protein [Acaryochloris marina]|uniref:hypothetical protein n=1 Tax=Acaryochloris marina TaxID=155978 RepID=UPI001BAF1F71|nr:hypothetical protein [Acaryochloris marina]QUY45469.1 hypothetical protein I1H34_27230 [Acaryochloris marina S15]
MTTDHVNANNTALIIPPEEKGLVAPPSSTPAEMENHLEILAQEVAHLRLSLLTETESFQKKEKRLDRRVNSLTFGFLIAILALVGGGTWFLSSPNSLKLLGQATPTIPTEGSQPSDIEPQINASRVDNSEQLISELKSLQEKVQALEADQSAVQELDKKVETLVTNTSTRQQTITTLANALQDVIDIETGNVTPEPSTSEVTPDSSSPENQAESKVSSPAPTSTPTTVENQPSPQPQPSPQSKPTN